MTRFFTGVLAVLFALGGAAAAQTAPRTITMSGEGTVSAAPTRVEISAGVTTDAPTAAAALSANTARMTGVFAALEKLGVPAKRVQTSNFSVSPQYDGTPGNPPRLSGYRVNNDVHVALDDVARLGVALDALVSAGANQMNGLSFSVRDTAALARQARADAVSDARAKAQDYAAAAGLTLGSILSLSEGSGTGVRPVFMAMRAPMPGKAVPVAAGEESVSATVSIVWEIH